MLKQKLFYILYFVKKKITFLYFDLGGVMFRFDGGLIALAKENNVTLEDLYRVFNTYEHDVAIGTISLQNLWEKYKNELHLKNSPHFDFLDYWTNYFVPIYETHTLVTELSSIYSIGILSNLYTGTLEKVIQKNFIPHIAYRTIIQSCEVKYAKPDREIYIIAQEKANIAPNEILFIDDRPENIQTAKELGWQTIQFETNNPSKSIAEITNVINTLETIGKKM